MLEIKVCADKNAVKSLYNKEKLDFLAGDTAVQAVLGEEVLGYVLFGIKDFALTVYRIFPNDDIMFIDGLLRSTLHVGMQRGITKAYYNDERYVYIFKKLNFLADENDKELNLINLYSDCCNCDKNNF